MAYWRNDKLYLHGSTQSVAQTVPNIARWVGIPVNAGRVHQRIHRRRLRQQDSGRAVDGDSGVDVEEAQWPAGDDAHLARGRNLHRPHSPRHSRRAIRMGFKKDGRVHGDRRVPRRTARAPIAARAIIRTPSTSPRSSISPKRCASAASRLRPTRLLACRSARRVACKAAVMFEPMLDKAARKLGIDEIEIRKINAPVTGSQFGLSEAPGGRAHGHELLPQGSARSRPRGVQLGRAQEARRASARAPKSAASPLRFGRLHRRVDRLRWPVRHQAGRQGLHPPGRRQSRHALGVRHRAHRPRDPRLHMGRLRSQLG